MQGNFMEEVQAAPWKGKMKLWTANMRKLEKKSKLEETYIQKPQTWNNTKHFLEIKWASLAKEVG
jgi:hypothetical protein